VLRPGGRLYVNFPPYYHPYGAHLSDAIYIPWVHLFFSERTLIEAYKSLVADLPDGAERIKFRISKKSGGAGTKERDGLGDSSEMEECPGMADGTEREYFSYINKMTIGKFRRLLKVGFPAKLVFYKEAPLRGFLAIPAKMPLLKEMLVKMVVAVFEKTM
jgi:hypothetical protein